jgi:uncharacterized membrane protein YsdA (DUF1294 family)
MPPVTAITLAALACLLLSLVTFIRYGQDKARARRNQRRISERSLLMLGLAGGWPGALLAQRLFRHKTSKRPFQMAFWMTVVAHCGMLALILSYS